jgi:asparagine synthase (glutamine-hydrolysing)
VALSGDGGDESFGGYRRYRMHLMEEKMRGDACRHAPAGVRLLGRMYPKADWAPRCSAPRPPSRRWPAIRCRPISTRVHPARRHAAQPVLQQVPRELAGYNALEVFRRHGNAAQTDDPLALIQYLDIKTYLVGDINTKVDRASMAHSLEVREPLMDHKLVEWLATLPSSLKIKGQEGKYLFKKAMEPLLPRRRAVPPQDGLCGAAGPLVPRPAQAARARGHPAPRWPKPASSTAITSSIWSTPTSPAPATTARPLWTT